MSLIAKISLQALNDYQKSVQLISDYSNGNAESAIVFDELLQSIADEISSLTECSNKLEDADTEISEKLSQYQEEKESIDSEISDLNEELDSVRSELESMDRFITIEDDDGHEINIPNPACIPLEAQIASLNAELAIKKSQRIAILAKIEKCNFVRTKLKTLSNRILSRTVELKGNKNDVDKYKNSYLTGMKALSVDSNTALINLKRIDKNLEEYLNARINVSSAFDRANNQETTCGINNREYLTQKFKNVVLDKRDKQFVDDNGKIYKTADGLVKNERFTVNGYTFITDNQGRTLGASGKLKLSTKKKDRDWDSTLSDIGKGHETKYDERGHIIGHRFDGPESILNAVPQHYKINKGAYKSFENYLAEELESGKDVYVDIRPVYKGDSHRPDNLIAIYTVNGIVKMRVFPNEYVEDE